MTTHRTGLAVAIALTTLAGIELGARQADWFDAARTAQTANLQRLLAQGGDGADLIRRAGGW